MCKGTSEVWLFEPSRNDGVTLAFELFVGDDLDAET